MRYKIFDGDTIINTIEADRSFVDAYTARHNYTAEIDEPDQTPEEPTQLDRLEAQALYTALLTGTLLEGK